MEPDSTGQAPTNTTATATATATTDAPITAAASSAAVPCASAGLRFDGSGSEYFRIWAVNLLLTLLTLGVYSAWAKVRKARWFARHTVLLGDRFDFHADPRRILLGRALALGLVLLWTHAFEIAFWVGLSMLALLCVVGPLLFASAQRFRLTNTSWRGLRFAFEVPRRKVYGVCVPAVLLGTAGTVLVRLDIPDVWVLAAVATTSLALPWAHARLKQLQHAHARFGRQGFSFDAAGKAFYGLYLKAMLLLVAGGAVSVPLAGLLLKSAQQTASKPMATLLQFLFVGSIVLLTWLLAWPYFAARMQQLVWMRTHWGEVRFSSRIRFMPMWRLALGQTLLTLLTAGLYWPFAAVAITRYRIESIVVESDQPLVDVVVDTPTLDDRRAAGDAAADFFGVDLGW